jgi:hypothetical protein
MSAEHTPEEIPTAIPVSERRSWPACPHCGSDDITKGMKLGLTATAGDVGINYHATGKFLGVSLLGNEPLLVDLCMACGTLTRIYVAETERKWT